MNKLMLEPSLTGPSLEQSLVADAMHPGVVTCPFETPLREVAEMMALYRIHAVVVFGREPDDVGKPGLWGVVSDLDLVKVAATEGIEAETAGGTAASPAVIVSRSDTLAHATQLMAEHEMAHLLVVDTKATRPVGILSTLDVARALAGFRQ
jgi:CBS domain-containing protein